MTWLGVSSRWQQSAASLLAPLAVIILLAGCSGNTAPSFAGGTRADSSGCTELLSDARRYVRSGQTGDGRLDWTLDEMAYRCRSEYDILVDEISGAKDYETMPVTGQAPASAPVGAISWSEAVNYVGSTQYVCGPLVNSGTSGDDVFLNLGRGYPDVERFTIVLWDVGGIESLPEDTTLCATGRITLYQGTAQIELRSTDAVEVWG